jgi:hypothetical protein
VTLDRFRPAVGGVLGQSFRVAVDNVELVPEVVSEHSIEHFEPLFAMFTLVEDLVVELSSCDLLGLFGDRLDVGFRLEQTPLELANLVDPTHVLDFDRQVTTRNCIRLCR